VAGYPTTRTADKANGAAPTDQHEGVVVDLADYRARAAASAHLERAGLVPTVPVPCCTCYGTPMGSGCGA
jgi:hypothetical protein